MKGLLAIILNCNGHAGFMGGEGDGGGGPVGNTATVVDPVTLEPDLGKNIAYPESLDKEYYGNPTLMKHYNAETKEFNVGGMMKGLIHATGNIGRDKMLVPHKDFTDDQWAETFKKLGLPDSADSYEVKNNIENGLLSDDNMLKGFKEVAHKVGILPKQAQSVLDFYNTAMGDSVSKQKEDSQVEIDMSIKALKDEWGADYARNIGVADASLKEFATDEEIKELQDSGLLSSTIMTKIFSKIGQSISDDNFVDGVKGTIGRSTEEIKSEIESYYDKEHPFMKSIHPQHKYYTGKMMKMLEAIHGTK